MTGRYCDPSPESQTKVAMPPSRSADASPATRDLATRSPEEALERTGQHHQWRYYSEVPNGRHSL